MCPLILLFFFLFFFSLVFFKIEHAGLREALLSTSLVVYRRPKRADPDAAIVNILPSQPLDRTPQAVADRLSAGPHTNLSLSFIHHGKTQRRATKCGESRWCHCQKCYMEGLARKEAEMKRIFKEAQNDTRRTNIQLHARTPQSTSLV
jgi:hypothetical protein